MKSWTVLLLATVALSGCGTATHPLDPYMMSVLDAPDACYYVDLKEEPWQQVASFTGIRSNPGSIPAFHLRMDGVAPQDNRIAVMECRFQAEAYHFVSVAGRFADEAAAQKWVGAAQSEADAFTSGMRCVPQALVFRDGAVVGAIGTLASEWHPAFQDAAQERFEEIRAKTGAVDHCE